MACTFTLREGKQFTGALILIEHIRGVLSSMSQCGTPKWLVAMRKSFHFMLLTNIWRLLMLHGLPQVQPDVAFQDKQEQG